MIEDVIRDLKEIKKIMYLSKDSIGSNSKEYQIALDLLVNMPLRDNVTPDELLLLYTRSMWVQNLSDGSNFGVASLLSDNLSNGFMFYNFNQELDKLEIERKTALSFNAVNLLNRKIVNGNIINIESSDITNDYYMNRSSLVNTPIANKELSTSLKLSTTDDVMADVGNKIDMYKKLDVKTSINPKVYKHLLVNGDERLDLYISRSPFLVKKNYGSPVLATSNHIINNDDDVLIYPDKIVCISAGAMNATCTFKTFKLPELTLIESGRDLKISIYKKLKLTRRDIVGPNIYEPAISKDGEPGRCKVQYGFRIADGKLYDVYKGSNNTLRNYKTKLVNNNYIAIYY